MLAQNRSGLVLPNQLHAFGRGNFLRKFFDQLGNGFQIGEPCVLPVIRVGPKPAFVNWAEGWNLENGSVEVKLPGTACVSEHLRDRQQERNFRNNRKLKAEELEQETKGQVEEDQHRQDMPEPQHNRSEEHTSE